MREVVAAVTARLVGLDNPGFCLACGNKIVEGVEPDAREYECEACGEAAVYGADEVLMMMADTSWTLTGHIGG